MKKLKIMIIANDTTYTYNLRNEIIERLVTDGHNVVIVSQCLLKQEELKLMGCKLINIKTKRHGTNPFSDLVLLNKYRDILIKEKPNMVLTFNIKPNVYGGLACQMTKIPYIANITGLGTAVEHRGLLQKISIILYKAGLVRANCIMFQNEENRQFFFNHHIISKSRRTRLLPGSGVSLKLHKPLDYPTDKGVIHFLFIARIMAEKGIDLYLNAAKCVHEHKKNVMFHICGQCDDYRYINLLKKAQKSGYIIYHGEQKDMIPFFKIAHCIVHPSYYPEGMSNVLLEAAAHCRPIIATDRAGCRETVDNGKNGYVIPIKDEGALTDAIEQFMSLSWEQKKNMGIAGREKIEREFDRQFVVKAYIEEIERALV